MFPALFPRRRHPRDPARAVRSYEDFLDYLEALGQGQDPEHGQDPEQGQAQGLERGQFLEQEQEQRQGKGKGKGGGEGQGQGQGKGEECQGRGRGRARGSRVLRATLEGVGGRNIVLYYLGD